MLAFELDDTWDGIPKGHPFGDKTMASGAQEDGNFGLQIAPMLDVLFVLLLFFMVCTGMQKHEAELGLKLPHGTLNGLPVTPITLKVETNGQVFFNDAPMDSTDSKDLHQLVGKLADILAKFGSDQPVIITPTGMTRHDRVVDVINACSSAGVKNLTFGSPQS